LASSFEPRGIDLAAADALLAAVSQLATPQTKRANAYLNEGVNKLIRAKRDQRDQELQPVRFWRPWWQNSDYWRGGNGKRTRISRCTGFVSATEWPIDDLDDTLQGLGAGESWWAKIAGTFFQDDPYEDDPYEDDPAAERKSRKTFLYRPGTAPLQRPDIGPDEPFRAIARLCNWQINNRHREQMQIPWPKFASRGECFRADRPRAFPDDPGGQCCRWTCGGFKTCPLQCWRRQK
jgi:hypothetical protein